MHEMFSLEKLWQQKTVGRFKLELDKYLEALGIEGHMDIGRTGR